MLAGLCLGYFMVLLDTTVVSVALPAIRSDLGGGLAGLQWVANAYTIVFAGLLLTMGALSDRLGAKRIYAAGLAAFVAASALSAAAPSLGALIALRALLGLGGAALLPASLALVANEYPDPARRTRALGIWAAVTGVALASGPVAGGVLVDAFGWRSIFLLNVPLGLASLAATVRLAAETPRQRSRGFDPAGQLAAIAAIAGLSYALMEGESYGWGSAPVLGALAIAIAAAAAFIVIEARGRSPLLPLSLFRHPTVSAGMLAGMAINVGFAGILFLLPLYFQQTLGWSAGSSGLALLPLTLPMAVGPILTGRLASRIGPRIPLTVGFVLVSAGTLVQAWIGADTPYAVPAAGLLLTGIGIPFIIPPLTAAVLSSAPKELTGAASGALNSSRQVGSALGVAIPGAIIAASGSFLSGLHLALLAAFFVLLAGGVLSYAYIGRRP